MNKQLLFGLIAISSLAFNALALKVDVENALNEDLKVTFKGGPLTLKKEETYSLDSDSSQYWSLYINKDHSKYAVFLQSGVWSTLKDGEILRSDLHDSPKTENIKGIVITQVRGELRFDKIQNNHNINR